MAKRIRKERESLNKVYIPKKRRDYIDFDYIKNLSPEEKKWLSQFSDEYYGAAFKINPTYIMEDGKMICIKGNEIPELDRDLRKYRRVQKYYKNEAGEYTIDTNYKYSQDNIHASPEQRKSCNKVVESLNRDIVANGLRDGKPVYTSMEDLQEFEGYGTASDDKTKRISIEDELILQEEIEIEKSVCTEEELREINDPNFIKKKRQAKNLGK